MLRNIGCALAVLALSSASLAAADWPQFMRNAAHTGDADDEELLLPLGLAAQIRLDDAVLTSPAIVAGRAYVVDQMGTAYCLDPEAGRIVWKTSPDGAGAMGSNTSSPCVAGGRVYYGTTAGTFHVLDIDDGRVVKTLTIGSPILSSPTLANNAIYFQALDAVLRSLDLEGNLRWQWDHYARYQEPPEVTKAHERERGHPGSYDRPHYGGGEVAVAGNKLVTSFGWDLACLEDAGTEARLAWCKRAPNGRDGSAPMSSSIGGEWVFTGGMGADGERRITRHVLATGERIVTPGTQKDAYAWLTPALRGSAATCRDSADGRNGVVLFDFEAKQNLASWRDEKQSTPLASSQALAKNHLVLTTLRGELVVVDLAAKPPAKPFRFQTPHGKGIASSPAIAGGSVYFGCDDGYFYVLSPTGDREPLREEDLAIHKPQSEVQPATGKKYAWPSTHGNAGNTSFADDPGLAPPLRVRWAARGFGHFLTPCIATETDLVSVSLAGLISCQEQATGRLRWRTQIPGPEWFTSSGMLAHEGRLFVPRPTFGSMAGEFHALDLATGSPLWSAPIGGRYIWERSPPVAAAGKVAFGFGRQGTPPGTLVQAWDAATGKPEWSVELNVAGNRAGSIAGCTDGQTMYFTAGAEAWQWKQEGEKQRGEAVAIDAATGKVVWRSTEVFGTTYPVLAGDRLLLNEQGKNLQCLTPTSRELLWQRPANYFTRISAGTDFLVLRGYGGHGSKVRLADGQEVRDARELGGPTHSCSPVALTPHFSFAATVGGLNVRDVKTGELLWQSPGFAPRGCVNPALANGRVFWPSAASGVVYCWDPAGPATPGNR